MSQSRRLGVREALVDGELVPGDVSLADAVIEAVGLPAGPAAVGTAVPGFVDWQVNGFGGVQFVEADASAMADAAAALGRVGVVLATPTLYSAGMQQYTAALAELAALLRTEPGCGLTGAHLEGPFLSPRFAGAHDPATFRRPDRGLLARLCDAGPVLMLTLAPELPRAGELIAEAHRAGLLVAVGHSDADADQCRAAADAGVGAITHCWNAHRRFSSRDPGPAGWALDDPRATIGLIADGVHVAPEVLNLTFAAAAGRVAVTSDAIAPAGSGATRWPPGDPDPQAAIRVEDGAGRLGDGTLAGSVATPSSMLRVLVDAGVDLVDAIDAMHRPQARALGLGAWSLQPGDPAHVVALDEDLSVRGAWRHGIDLWS